MMVNTTTIYGESATATVELNPTTKRYLGAGETSTLDRRKFVGLHTVELNEDADFEKFKKDYNLGDDYIGSRRFSYPVKDVKSGVIPDTKKIYHGERDVVDHIAAAKITNVFYDKNINYAEVDYSPYLEKLTDYVARALRDDWKDVPKYIESFNEPMIHAGDVCKGVKGADKKKAIDAVITYICEYSRDLARSIHSLPELKNVTVMGFGSAFPEFESGDFAQWNSRFKQFIDIAGDDVDALSVHLYDGSGVNNAGGRRSGSNMEAILDILQTYSFIKTGAPLPIAITEYGRLVPNEPEWEAQTGAVGNAAPEGGLKKPTVSNYNPVTNAQAVRSQLHMVTSFMNRQDEIVRTVPFTVGKSSIYTMYCKSSLWVRQDDGSYEYSNRRFFFEMLKDLKGDNTYTKSSNVDIQTISFVDGNEAYLLLNNLYDIPCDITLNNTLTKDLAKVNVKTLKIFTDKEPECKSVDYKSAPKSITLDYGETAVVTYKYKKPIKYTNEVARIKYYSKDYLKPIETDVANKFTFEGVKCSDKGDALLRIAIGRAHGVALNPKQVKVNGTAINVERDLIKGYDQNTRKQFFGALELPFDISLLKSGTNNVEVIYGDNGGRVASVILQVESAR